MENNIYSDPFLCSYLTNIIFRCNVTEEDSILLPEQTLDSNKIFSKSLLVTVNPDEIEVPLIARNLIERVIFIPISYPTYHEVKKVVVPLYIRENGNKVIRSFNKIARYIFLTDVASRLRKFVTSKGDIYYGGRGILLDSNYNPLLLCTLAAKHIKDRDVDKLVYYRPIIHVSPEVLSNSDKLVCKGIITKLLPLFTHENIYFPDPINEVYPFTSIPEDRKAKVIIDNFDNFFVEPIKPKPSTCSNEALNQCLIDNIEDVVTRL